MRAASRIGVWRSPVAYDNPLIRVEIDSGVAFATIDAPPINLMGGELLGALTAFGSEVETDELVKVVVLRSADADFFVAHGDVETIAAFPQGPARERPSEPGFVHQTLDRFRTMPKVTIAQIEGFARGGGSELALACDMRFATLGKAVLGQPEIGLGILPGAGGTVRLARLVGRARASEIIFGGDDFSAEEAAAIGWVNRALPPEELGPYVEELAHRIASFPAAAIAQIKRVFAEVEAETSSQLTLEEHAFGVLMAGPEARPRMQQWLDRGFQTREGEATIGADLQQLRD
jgi:enoyl-CoA hydratase/carnithine racemase